MENGVSVENGTNLLKTYAKAFKENELVQI